MTHRELVAKILARIPAKRPETVDTFKSGDPDAPITGIVTTFIATMDVLQEAVRRGANLVITHEPTYYNHFDKTEDLQGDPVVEAKRRFIEEHKLVLWRFHDYWHAHRPDGIAMGFAKRMGWEAFLSEGDPTRFVIPPVTLQDLAAQIKSRLQAKTIRVVGDPGLRCSKIAIRLGAGGGEKQLEYLRGETDLLIAGESPEWVACEYVRDAAFAGSGKALLVVGHCNGEEPGMAYLAEWLKPLSGSIPIAFVPAGDPFRTA